MSENNNSNMGPLLLAFLTVALVFLGFTDLGQVKAFRFVLGEIAMITAVASMSRGKSHVLGVVCWFIVASVNFAMAAWLTR